MIAVTDAVVDVRAVMIKTFYTSVAYVAVSATWSSDNFAIRAQVEWVSLIEDGLEINEWVSCHITRVLERCK